MIPPDPHVRDEHLRRTAYVYVRQSTLAQVHEHQESTRRQYALRNRAQELGWSAEHIQIIDEDLGHSASDAGQRRAGFEKLLGYVVTGQAGAIFSLEVSRLARQDSEGHRLVEVAALTDTLLIDEQQVYDPCVPDDRLMLGLKVLLSSTEIRLMNQRLRDNRLRKAQRGELRINVPVGLIYVPQGGIQLDPDEQVRSAVQLLFERFRLSGHLSTVVRYFHENGLLFPRRQGTWHGQLEWSPLSLERTRDVLANPLYAGAYVYGRTKRQTIVRSEQRIERPRQPLPPAEWVVARWEAFEGYLSREEFEANQAQLAANRAKPHVPSRSRRRDGPALLGGCLVCGRCGQPMHVGYQGTNGSRSVYLCNSRQIHYGEHACQRVPGKAIDRWVVESLLAALTPAQIELSLAIVNELERQQAEVAKQWERRVEAAQYAARQAQTRYEQVDPANRLVARTLEQAWEARLADLDHLETEWTAFARDKPLSLSAEQRRALLSLASDLAQVWSAPTTSWTERKDLLELLIADVTLTRHDAGTTVQIRWWTNQVDTGLIPLPPHGGTRLPDTTLDRIRNLCASHTDQEIADILAQEGITTPHGQPYTAQRVARTRYQKQLSRRRSQSH